MTIALAAVAELAIAQNPVAAKTAGGSPPKRRTTAHRDTTLTPEAR